MFLSNAKKKSEVEYAGSSTVLVACMYMCFCISFQPGPDWSTGKTCATPVLKMSPTPALVWVMCSLVHPLTSLLGTDHCHWKNNNDDELCQHFKPVPIDIGWASLIMCLPISSCRKEYSCFCFVTFWLLQQLHSKPLGSELNFQKKSGLLNECLFEIGTYTSNFLYFIWATFYCIV